MKSQKVRQIVDTAILVALGIVLKLISDLIPFLNLPVGGTVDLAMLAIVLVGLRNGPKYSFLGAGIYMLITWATKGFVIYVIPDELSGNTTAIMSEVGFGKIFLEILLDRLVPYIVGYGIAGLFYKKRNNRVFTSFIILMCGIIRLFSHTLSGMIVFGSLTSISDLPALFWSSFVYNLAYVGITTVVAIVLYNATKFALFYKAPLEIKLIEKAANEE